MTVKLSGWETFLSVYDKDSDLVATRSAMGLPGLTLIVDGKEYNINDLGEESELVGSKTSARFKDIDITELADRYDASSIARLARKGTVTLEIDDNGASFDPKKAALVIRKIQYAYHPEAGQYFPTQSENIVVGFIYDEVVKVNPELGDVKPDDEVWWTGCTE